MEATGRAERSTTDNFGRQAATRCGTWPPKHNLEGGGPLNDTHSCQRGGVNR